MVRDERDNEVTGGRSLESAAIRVAQMQHQLCRLAQERGIVDVPDSKLQGCLGRSADGRIEGEQPSDADPCRRGLRRHWGTGGLNAT